MWRYISLFRYFLSFSFENISELFCCEFFDISLIYYTNISSSIIFSLSSGYTCLSLAIFLSCSFVTVFEIFHCEFTETFLILLGILLLIKSAVPFAVFLNDSS